MLDIVDKIKKSISINFLKDALPLNFLPKIILIIKKINKQVTITIPFKINLFKNSNKKDFLLSSSYCSKLPIQKIVE